MKHVVLAVPARLHFLLEANKSPFCLKCLWILSVVTVQLNLVAQIRPFRVVGAAAKVNLCSRNEQTADDKGVIIDSSENREDWRD